jgi:D-alanyl-D-alanine dipeptidase
MGVPHFALLAALAAFAQAPLSAQQTETEQSVVATPVPTASAFDAEPGCPVAPLNPIDDAAAQQLEASTGTEIVDIAHMIPAAARALNLFQSKVASLGGTLTLKSAFRPATYQKHLQDVWYKWMRELKNNHNSACQVLRAAVQDEFVQHRLIATQHPVAVSDHTRGLAFDATVILPKIGHRLSLDRLARLVGLSRPAIAADPVHFKFFGSAPPRYLTALRRRNSNVAGRRRKLIAG